MRVGLVPAEAVLPQLPLVRLIGVELRQWLTHAVPRPDRDRVYLSFLQASRHLDERWKRWTVRSGQLMANPNDRTGDIYVRFEIREIAQPFGPLYSNVRWHVSLVRLQGPLLRHVREWLEELSDAMGLEEMNRDLFLHAVPWPQLVDVMRFLISGRTHHLCLTIGDQLFARFPNTIVHDSVGRLRLDIPTFEPPPDPRT